MNPETGSNTSFAKIKVNLTDISRSNSSQGKKIFSYQVLIFSKLILTTPFYPQMKFLTHTKRPLPNNPRKLLRELMRKQNLILSFLDTSALRMVSILVRQIRVLNNLNVVIQIQMPSSKCRLLPLLFIPMLQQKYQF